MEFDYFLPVHIVFGARKVEQLGAYTAKYGNRALLVTGTGSTKKTGLLDRAIALLESSQVEVVVYDEVTPNPLSSTVEKGVSLAKMERCNVVIGLGGGSIMDCAKAIAFSYYNEGDIFDYIFGKKTGDSSLPLILVPTTCGTGSEGNCFAVLTNPVTNDKKSLRNIASIAKVSIVDPELMETMPKEVLASVGFDALCHNMEAYISKITQPLVEIQALYAIGLIVESLPRLIAGTGDMRDYEMISLGATLGGMNINMAGVCAPHGMEHPASGLRNIVHGNGLASLSPVIYELSIDAIPEKFRQLSLRLGGQSKDEFVPRFLDFLERINLRINLSDQGIKKQDVGWMVENCYKVSAPALAAHPKQFSKEELMEIYYRAIEY